MKNLSTAELERMSQYGSSETAESESTKFSASCWPEPLNEAALYGLAGEIVRAIEPHTEADPAALLSQTLCAFGNVAGRNAYYQVEADRHYSNLYVVLVGPTAKGRKGTSKGQVMALFRAVDETWTTDCVQSGLSSGEGLIWAVRDPIEDTEPIKEKKRVVEYQKIVVDPGVQDKRLLAFEPEFARTLRVSNRDGNTLSANIRDGWDNGHLRSMTKSSPARATGAHISMIGHITKDELRRYLDSTEAANGFANRFLWLCVKRSKCLPEGGQLSEVDFAPIVDSLRLAVDIGRKAGRVQLDPEAREAWHKVYPELSAGSPGLFGSVTSRAEAQVVRLALVYALLDRSDHIRKAHLLAALALWEYAEASARFIFGAALGDPVADEILTGLRRKPEGMSRTEISSLFARHQRAAQIARALSMLLEQGTIRTESVVTDGRYVEKWFALGA